MAKKKTKKADPPPATPVSVKHPDTLRLDALQYVLSKKYFSGKISIRHSPKNKGLLIEETMHQHPMFGDLRDAIDDFMGTHGLGEIVG